MMWIEFDDQLVNTNLVKRIYCDQHFIGKDKDGKSVWNAAVELHFHDVKKEDDYGSDIEKGLNSNILVEYFGDSEKNAFLRYEELKNLLIRKG